MHKDPDSANSVITYEVDSESEHLVLLPSSNEKALEWLAVVGATGIGYSLIKTNGRWRILIAEKDRSRALDQLSEFERECEYWPPKFDSEPSLDNGISLISVYVGIYLFFFFLITGAYDPDVIWFDRGQGDAVKIYTGELWRSVTALTLHSDFSHVIGNALCCVFLCGQVCQILGQGSGWLLILLSGVMANILTSLMHRSSYIYIGASTAVFAALGILGAINFTHLRRTTLLRSYRLYLPIVSVFAIMSFMGTGPKADIAGHFMGAVCGLFLGFFCSFLKTYRDKTLFQLSCLTVAIVILFVSWSLALEKLRLN